MSQSKAAPLQPQTPENKNLEYEQAASETLESQIADEKQDDAVSSPVEEEKEEEEQPEQAHEESKTSVDEYGNKLPKKESKTYTEEEHREAVNRAIRERLERLERSQSRNQDSSRQTPQASKEFQAPQGEESGDWQEQLKSFIRQTNEELAYEQARIQNEARLAAEQEAFQHRFQTGMQDFSDFHEVVGNKPFTDAMVLATKALSHPAHFMYAASKTMPQEIERIARIASPEVQMVEIGKLEERLKKSKPVTSAPKPISRSKEDAHIKPKAKPTAPTIEDMMQDFENKRVSRFNSRRTK